MQSILTHAALFAALPWQAIAKGHESVGGKRYVYNLGACRRFDEATPKGIDDGSHEGADPEFILHKTNPSQTGVLVKNVTDLDHCKTICSALETGADNKTCYGIEYITSEKGIDQCEVWTKPILHAEVVDNKDVKCEVYTLEHELEPVYDWTDMVNNQQTFHFKPAWDHDGTAETEGGIQFYAYKHWSPFTEPVFAHWHSADKQHTFRFYGPHTGEVLDPTPQFYAFRYQVHSALGAVYSWYNANHNNQGSGNHNFHFEPAWHEWETKENTWPEFYAFRYGHTPDDEFSLVDAGACRGANEDDNSASHFTEYTGGEYAVLAKCMEQCVQTEGCTGIEHSPTEDKGRCEVWTRAEGINATVANAAFSCYRYRFYPDAADMAVVPIYEWWDSSNTQHTYHYPPAWKHGDLHEHQLEVAFWAHGSAYPNSTAIFDFWDGKQHVFHPEPAGAGEIKGTGNPFYAYTNESKDMYAGLQPVYMFLDTDNSQNTFHFLPKRANEEVKGVVFYAWPSREAAESDIAKAEPADPEVGTTAEPIQEGDSGEGGDVEEFGSGVQTASITFNGNYSEVVGDDKEGFLEECSAKLDPVQCVDVREGSIIVDVTGTAQQLADAVQEVKNGFDLPSFISLQATDLPEIVLNFTANETVNETDETGMKKQDTDSNARGVAGSSVGLLAMGMFALLQGS